LNEFFEIDRERITNAAGMNVKLLKEFAVTAVALVPKLKLGLNERVSAAVG
jgi:hypothetical protein